MNAEEREKLIVMLTKKIRDASDIEYEESGWLERYTDDGVSLKHALLGSSITLRLEVPNPEGKAN